MRTLIKNSSAHSNDKRTAFTTKVGRRVVGLKYIMISFDSLNSDVFKLQRGVSLQKTLDGVNAVLKIREGYADMVIHITAIITKHNIGEMCVLADYCKQHNI